MRGLKMIACTPYEYRTKKSLILWSNPCPNLNPCHGNPPRVGCRDQMWQPYSYKLNSLVLLDFRLKMVRYLLIHWKKHRTICKGNIAIVYYGLYTLCLQRNTQKKVKIFSAMKLELIFVGYPSLLFPWKFQSLDRFEYVLKMTWKLV